MLTRTLHCRCLVVWLLGLMGAHGGCSPSVVSTPDPPAPPPGFARVDMAVVPSEVLPADLPITVPGAPPGCHSSYVLATDFSPSTVGGAFQQVPGELEGPAWGACMWMGPLPEDYQNLWVVMVWRPGWRGAARCRLEGALSPLLLVGSSAEPPEAPVKVKWYQSPPGASDQGGPPFPIPTDRSPCEAGSPPLHGAGGGRATEG